MTDYRTGDSVRKEDGTVAIVETAHPSGLVVKHRGENGAHIREYVKASEVRPVAFVHRAGDRVKSVHQRDWTYATVAEDAFENPLVMVKVVPDFHDLPLSVSACAVTRVKLWEDVQDDPQLPTLLMGTPVRILPGCGFPTYAGMTGVVSSDSRQGRVVSVKLDDHRNGWPIGGQLCHFQAEHLEILSNEEYRKLTAPADDYKEGTVLTGSNGRDWLKHSGEWHCVNPDPVDWAVLYARHDPKPDRSEVLLEAAAQIKW